MNYGDFVGVSSGVSGLQTLLSRYEGASLRIAGGDYGISSTVEVYYNADTNTITLA